MHIIVVGCGRVGAGLAHVLERQGHTVAVVDRRPKAFRRLPADFRGRAIEGSGFDRDALIEAGVKEAGALAAVTSGDNSNILAARIARETFGIDHVVARIYDPRRAEVYKRLGIPTVATVTWTVDQVHRRVLPEESSTAWTDATGTLLLIERVLPDHLAGKRLATLDESGSARLVAVTRAGIPRLDGAQLVGQEGDLLHLAVAKADLAQLDSLLAAPAGPRAGQ